LSVWWEETDCSLGGPDGTWGPTDRGLAGASLCGMTSMAQKPKVESLARWTKADKGAQTGAMTEGKRMTWRPVGRSSLVLD